jgi:hypothetical protein
LKIAREASRLSDLVFRNRLGKAPSFLILRTISEERFREVQVL